MHSDKPTDRDALDGEAWFGDHKREQLCSQVSEAIAYALAASRDGELRDLIVDEVEPLRGTACLRVHVLAAAETPDEADRALAKLERASGYLRAEVASSINRKRVPELVFQVVPADANLD